MWRGKYFVLGLAPKQILEKDKYLKIFWTNIETLYENILPIVVRGRSNEPMNELEKMFTGLRRYSALDEDYVAMTAKDLLAFTRFFHGSAGSRMGNLLEDLIGEWLKDEGYVVVRDSTLKEALRHFLNTWQDRWEGAFGRSKIDFVLRKNNKLVLMELRMSEDTGGRTGQESLMDKFNKFLELLASEKEFASAIRESHIENVDLIIETVFSEGKKSIVDQPSTGRLNSLISYLCEENHIYGKIKDLIEISKDRFGEELRNNREFSFDYESIHISLKLMYGNEFFKTYIGRGLDELLNELMVPDDVWLLFTVAVNELRRSKLSNSGKTLTFEVYEILRGLSGEDDTLLERYEREIQNVDDLNVFVNRLDEMTNDIRDQVLKAVEDTDRRFVILDTEDVSKSYRYLKCVAYCVLIVHKFRKMLEESSESKTKPTKKLRKEV